MDEIPGGQAFENAVNNFNKKAAGAVMNIIKRILATASEPFFRKDLGERFFTGDTGGSAIGLWFVATIVSCGTGNLMGLFSEVTGLRWIGSLFGSKIFTLCVGLLFIAVYASFVKENKKRLRQFRNEGQLYHSFSRGVPRWDNPKILLMVIGAVFVFVPVLGVLFLISAAMGAKLAAEQQAMIYSKYLDALDQRIEKEFMEKALLGECEPQITYLAKPLPNDIDPDVRKDMAAAAVGKPVALATVGPKSRKKKTDGPQPGAPETNMPAETERQSRAAALKPAITVNQIKEALEVGAKTCRSALGNIGQKTVDLSARAIWFRYAVAGISMIALTTWAVTHFRSSQPQKALPNAEQPASAARSEPKPVVAAVETKPQIAEQSPVIAAPAPDVTSVATTPVGLAPVPIQDLEQQRRDETQKAVQQEHQGRESAIVKIHAALEAQAKEAAAFKTDYENRLNDNQHRLVNITSRSRGSLKDQNEHAWQRLASVMELQQKFLNICQERAGALDAKSQEEIQAFKTESDELFSKMKEERDKLGVEISNISSAIASTPGKRTTFFSK